MSHDHLEQFRDKVQSSMTYINNENQQIHDVIESNSVAIKESVKTLQNFQSFMNPSSRKIRRSAHRVRLMLKKNNPAQV